MEKSNCLLCCGESREPTAKILCDIIRLFLNEAYIALGLRELLPSDQTPQRCGLARQHNKPQPLLRVIFMVISNISKLKFDQLLPMHGLLETVIGKEVEWFADDGSKTIGTIAGAKADRGWNFAILRRDRMGNFRMCNLRRNLYNLHAATIDFLRSMAAAENTSQWTA